MKERADNNIAQEAPVRGGTSALSVRSANLLFLITVLCLTILSGISERSLPSSVPIVITYIIMLITAVLLCRKEGIPFPQAFRFRRVRGRTLLMAVIITVALQPVAGLIANLTNLLFPNLLDVVEDSLYGGPFLLNLVTVALIPGFCEEFLLRGNAANAYSRTGRVRAAVLLSSLLFGLIHQNATQFFYAFAMGVVLALLFLASDSIWPGVLVHFLNNGASVVEELVKKQHGAEFSNRIFVFSKIDFSNVKNVIFYVLAFLIGLAVIGLCLRVVARDEGNEQVLAQCTKGGGGTAKLWTPALVIAFIFLIVITVIITGAMFFADDIGLSF